MAASADSLHTAALMSAQFESCLCIPNHNQASDTHAMINMQASSLADSNSSEILKNVKLSQHDYNGFHDECKLQRNV